MIKEVCKRHNIDYTGTICGQCYNLFERKAKKLDRIARVMKQDRSMTIARFKELYAQRRR